MKPWSIWLLLLCLPLLGFSQKFWGSSNTTLRAEIKTVEAEFKIKNETLKILQSKETSVFDQNAHKKIPLTHEQENIIRDLELIGKKSRFKMSDFSFSKGVNSTIEVPELVISFDVLGGRKDLPNFLSLIEANERFLGLETLHVQGAGDPDLVSMGVSLYAFYQE